MPNRFDLALGKTKKEPKPRRPRKPKKGAHRPMNVDEFRAYVAKERASGRIRNNSADYAHYAHRRIRISSPLGWNVVVPLDEVSVNCFSRPNTNDPRSQLRLPHESALIFTFQGEKWRAPVQRLVNEISEAMESAEDMAAMHGTEIAAEARRATIRRRLTGEGTHAKKR